MSVHALAVVARAEGRGRPASHPKKGRYWACEPSLSDLTTGREHWFATASAAASCLEGCPDLRPRSGDEAGRGVDRAHRSRQSRTSRVADDRAGPCPPTACLGYVALCEHLPVRSGPRPLSPGPSRCIHQRRAEANAPARCPEARARHDSASSEAGAARGAGPRTAREAPAVPDAAYALANLWYRRRRARAWRDPQNSPIPASTPARSSPRAAGSGSCSGACSACSSPTSTSPPSRCSRTDRRLGARAARVLCARSSARPGSSVPGSSARSTIEAFSALGGVDHIVTTSGVCGGELTRYGDLLGTPQARAFSAMVRDLSELLTQQPPRTRAGGCRSASPPRIVPTRARAGCPRPAPGAAARDPRAAGGRAGWPAYVCCGGAGLTPLLQPQTATELGERAGPRR